LLSNAYKQTSMADPKAENNPNPTPMWVKETLVEDTILGARKRGVDMNPGDVQRIIESDLRLVDAMERDEKPRQKAPESKSVKDRTGTKERPLDPAGDVTRELSEVRGQKVKMRNRPITNKSPAHKRTRCLCGQCRACKMTHRMGILMQRYPSTVIATPDGCLNWHAFMFPGYARECWALMENYKQSAGPFRGKKRTERDSMVVRLMEDICDRSNVLLGLGNWWVK
jgi:hypothetical protein